MRVLWLSPFALAGGLSAQLTVTEILVDPVGADAGRQVVEIRNETTQAFTPSGWNICAPFVYAALPKIAVPAGGVVRLHLGAKGTDTKTDWYFPLFRTLLKKDTFLLYKSAVFTNSKDIVDFVSWGGGTLRIDQAVSVKKWPSLTATVPLPSIEGATITRIGPAGTPASWFPDATPTLGRVNPTGTVTAYGAACGGGTPPVLAFPVPAFDGSLGFSVATEKAPPATLAILLVSTRRLSGLTFFSCPIHVLPTLFSVGLPTGAKGRAVLPLPLFVKGGKLGGLKLTFQSLVIDRRAANGVFRATAGAEVVLGS